MPLPRSCVCFALCMLLTPGCGRDGSGPETQDPAADASEPGAGTAQLFVDATADRGIDFEHHSGSEGELAFPEMMGGGVAVFDADRDGDLDLYFVSGAPDLGRGGAGGPVNRLFLQDETGRYHDATAASGLGDPGYGTGVAIGDMNNDGLEDVFVANFGQDRLYLGRGEASFEDVTEAAGLSSPLPAEQEWSTSAAFCDFDRDGHLDLYVVRYVVYDPEVRCTDKAGRPEYCGPDNYEDRTDRLLHNQRDGTFRDVSAEAGIESITGAGLGLVCDDFDDDGWVDVYVANDGDPNQLWMNRSGSAGGELRFVDEALIMGASVNAMGLDEAGMGVVAADFDNDTDLDLFLTHLRDETNTFYRNLGPGTGFEDQTVQSGLAAGSAPYTGFGTAAVDIDLDADLDLVIVNGRVRYAEPLTSRLPEPWNAYAEPNLVYRNDGGSFRLLDDEVASFASEIEVGRGLASGDLDGDGDLDLVLSNIGSPARLYRAEPSPGHWLLVDAFDPRLNRRALGARVTACAGERCQVRTVHGANSYLSASDPRAHFGLGGDASPISLVVRWPDGPTESFGKVEVDRTIVLRRGEGVE